MGRKINQLALNVYGSYWSENLEFRGIQAHLSNGIMLSFDGKKTTAGIHWKNIHQWFFDSEKKQKALYYFQNIHVDTHWKLGWQVLWEENMGVGIHLLSG